VICVCDLQVSVLVIFYPLIRNHILWTLSRLSLRSFISSVLTSAIIRQKQNRPSHGLTPKVVWRQCDVLKGKRRCARGRKKGNGGKEPPQLVELRIPENLDTALDRPPALMRVCEVSIYCPGAVIVDSNTVRSLRCDRADRGALSLSASLSLSLFLCRARKRKTL